jgi:hypothetical protein
VKAVLLKLLTVVSFARSLIKLKYRSLGNSAFVRFQRCIFRLLIYVGDFCKIVVTQRASELLWKHTYPPPHPNLGGLQMNKGKFRQLSCLSLYLGIISFFVVFSRFVTSFFCLRQWHYIWEAMLPKFNYYFWTNVRSGYQYWGIWRREIKD